jgi:hypothetical protein
MVRSCPYRDRLPVSLIAVRQLPATVTLDFSRLLPFSVPAEEESASSLMLFVVPGTMAVLWALFRWLQSESAAKVARALYPGAFPTRR